MGKLILTLASNFEDLKNSVIEKVNEKNDLENIIIVPDRFSLLAELSVFKQKNIKCMFNTSVMPITKFATSLLEKLSISLNLISSDEEGFLIRRAIQKVKNSFCCLSPNLTMGMCDEIAKTISQLKSCKISSVDLTSENLTNSLSGKIADIKLIYEEYERILSGNCDGSKMLEIFEKNIERMTFLKDMNLYFVGFESLTTQIYEIIKLLHKMANLIVIGGYYHFNQNNKRVFETDIYDKFKTMQAEKDFEIENIKSSLLPWQEHINQNVFANKQEKIENDEHVLLLKAENSKQEIQFVINEILKNIKQNGMRFSDFSIAHSNISEIQAEFESELKKAGINYFFDTSFSLLNTSLAKFILGFYTLILNHFEIADLKNFFSSVFISDDLLVQSKIMTLIDKYLIEKENFINFDMTKILPEDKEQFAEFIKVSDITKNLYDEAQKCVIVNDYVNLTNNLMEDFSCKEKIDNLCLILENSQELKEQKIYKQVFDKVQKTLLSVSAHLESEKINLEEFYDILLNAFTVKKITTVPISGDCVFIGDATDSFYSTPKILFVMGANYNALPKTIFDSGLINDDNIKELDKIMAINPTTKTINKRNKFKLLNILTRASEKLVVTYENISEEGKENLPSGFVLDLQNIFTSDDKILPIDSISKKVKTAYDSFDNQREYILNNITNLHMAKEFLFKHAKDEIFDKKLINSVYDVLKENNFVSESELELFKENQSMPKIENARLLFFKKDKTKISQLENYFSSPFKHFINYGLCLKECESGEIKRTDIGKFMHYVAEKFILENKNILENLNKEKISQIVENIVKSIKNNSEFHKFFINKQNVVLLSYLTGEAKNLCGIICSYQQMSNFKPAFTEKDFNVPNYFEKQKLALVGRVDRIDEFDNYFTVYDYKTGKVEFNARVIYMGQKIQLLIYAQIYEQISGKKCAGVFYFPIRNSFALSSETKLQGAFLRDEYVILNLDKTLNQDNLTSSMINANINKKDNGKIEFRANTGTNNLEGMLQYAKKVSEQAIDEILEGHIDVIDEENASIYDSFISPQFKKLKQNKISVSEDVFKFGEKDDEK